jgi:Flp pilus assembly CpaF family ATPase
MDFVPAEPGRPDPTRASGGAATEDVVAPIGLKILIAGGFGVGKTTLVATLSEIPPLRRPR